MCAGGYAVAFAARQSPQLDSALLLLIGAGTGLLLGVVVGSFVVRYRAIFFGMLNLALSMVLYAVLGKFFHLTGGTDGLRLERAPFFGMALDRDNFESLLLLCSVVLALITGWLVRHCRQSRRMKHDWSTSVSRPTKRCGLAIFFLQACVVCLARFSQSRKAW